MADISNVLNIKKAFCKRRLSHGPYLIDPNGHYIECKSCGIAMNPMAVLCEISKKESSLRNRFDYLSKQIEALEGRTRTKCHHCKKMTDINITLKRVK